MIETPLGDDLYVLGGAVNTGVIISDRKALLIDCCDTVTAERLAALGAKSVEMILCTQHRRSAVAGAYAFVREGAQLVASEQDRHLFEDTDAYWDDPANRWHIFHHQPGPQVLARSLPVARSVSDGEIVEWRGHRIRVLDTPGATDGSVSYLVESGGRTVCFSGDAIYGPGQLWDIYSLQKGHGCVRDYHGFMGNRFRLIPSLQKLSDCGADVLVPSHGEPIEEPQTASALLLDRLDAIWRNYATITCINHYFPDLLSDLKDDPRRMKRVNTFPPPDHVRRVAGTSYAVISDSGAALLIDCGNKIVVEALHEWIDDGVINSVDACWVSHYHNDHVNALGDLIEAFECPIMTDQHMAEMVEAPLGFFLPCISDLAAPVARKTQERESWKWHEFQLTGFHFPGQTYYHSGLLVEGHGKKVFFAGDSGSPTGVDDHCCPNRIFLGKDRGFRRCIAIWQDLKPDYIFNEHQAEAFSFTDAELDYMDGMLAEREQLLGEMLPWAHPNFGSDENWVRAYPYETRAAPGEPFSISIQFTNHGRIPVETSVEPVLPAGWVFDRERSAASVTVPADTDGSTDDYCARPDGACNVWLSTQESAKPGRFTVPFRITWGDRYLGQFRHAVVELG